MTLATVLQTNLGLFFSFLDQFIPFRVVGEFPSQLHVGKGWLQSRMSLQLIAGPYASIWGSGTLL